jgi:WXG100 family type VII secretion target
MAEGFVLLDTDAIDAAISKKEDFLSRYDQINQDFDRIVETLRENWRGEGARAFENDAQEVRTNLTGIYDILKTMCDVLTDCRNVIGEMDSAIGKYNREP